jgi:hypothetical protein
MRVQRLPLALGAVAVLGVVATDCSKSGGGGNPTGPPAGQALVRFVHAVGDAHAYDFWVNHTETISGLVYLKGTAYSNVDTNSASLIQVTPKADSANVAIAATYPLTDGHTFTFYVVGPSASMSTLFTSDSNTAPAGTFIKLRVVHVAPSSPSLDVYITPIGATLPATPTIAALPFKTPSTYQLVAPGDWEVRLTTAGNTTVAVDDTLLGLANGAVRTVVAMDNLGGGLPLHAINLPDAR